MKRILSFLLLGLFITSMAYASTTTFKDTAGIGDHNVIIGTSTDANDPNSLEIYGGGTGAYDDAGATAADYEYPGFIKLWSSATTPTAYYLWVDSTGDLRIGTDEPSSASTRFDQEGSGTVVGAQS